MRQEILDRLSPITPEEQELLRGGKPDMSLYNRAGDNVMEPGKLLPGGELFGIRPHTRFADFPRHSHQYVEMIYQAQGQTTHRVDDKETIVLTPGKLLLLGRGASHSIAAAGERDIAVNFFLIPAFFDNAAMSLGENNALAVFLQGNLNRQNAGGGHLLYDISGGFMAENLLENLIEGQFLGVSQSLQQLTLELLLRHLSTLPENLVLQTSRDREQALVLGVLAGIEQNVRQNLSETAAGLGLEVTTLSRMIKRQTGCTFTQLLHTARFNRAAALLKQTELSVEDVAATVGYENTAFFYRRFRQYYGCTPAQYREAAKSDIPAAK